MRTLTLTLTLSPIDGRFDPLTGDQLLDQLYQAFHRAWPNMHAAELDIEVIADVYEPTVPK